MRQSNDITYGISSIDKTITNSVAYQNQKSLLNKSLGVKMVASSGSGRVGSGGSKIDLNSIYTYKVETFASFGTITCTAENDIGQSGPCMYNIVAAGECLLKYIKC